MRKIAGFLIFLYQRLISPFRYYLFGPTFAGRCVFYPSCSSYTKQAIMKYGLLKGFFLGLKRIIRCHPWQKEHIDPLV